MSLISKLNEAIKLNGYMSLDEIYKLTEELGFKQSNAERRLRKSESPFVNSVKNAKHYIVGYKYVGYKGDAGMLEKPKKKVEIKFGDKKAIHFKKYGK